jgi:hypothetical protein
MVQVPFGFTGLNFEAIFDERLHEFSQDIAGPSELHCLAKERLVRFHAHSDGDELFEWFGLLDHLFLRSLASTVAHRL